MEKLKVYYWSVCPHCHSTMAWLDEHNIPYEALNIEQQPEEVVRKVVEVNGGDDWVVPTMEYKGQWRPGQAFDAQWLEEDLRKWGLLDS